MFTHTHALQFEAKPDGPDADFARKMQEVLGGQWGEMTVATQYLLQGWNCRLPGKYKDMLLAIGTEELAHVEMIVTMIDRLLDHAPLKPDAADRTKEAAAGYGMTNPQHTIANAYPGIYQGLVTTCSYPDTLTAGAQFADYHLLRKYFEDPSRWSDGVVWSPTQMAEVEGHLTHMNAVVADEGLFKAALNPENDCSGTVDTVPGDPSTRYDSETNPAGVRCSVLDIMVNLLGRRPEGSWSAQEQAA